MRTLSPTFAQHLTQEATSLCHCWKLTTQKQETLGFTDHDRALIIDDIVYEAEAGFTPSEMTASTGLCVDNLEAAGALQSSKISQERVQAGDFDFAKIEIWRVNWQDPQQRFLLRTGFLGEITRTEQAFCAELRGLTELLNQPRGRLFKYGCDAILGDKRCGVLLNNLQFQANCRLSHVENNRYLLVQGLTGFANDWFSRGKISWQTGANKGQVSEIKCHMQADLELWQQTAFDLAIGDQFIAYAGCDKQFSTCRQKFANGLNFRGFPHMPGNDFVSSYPR